MCVCNHVAETEQRTFVSDEVSAEDDEEAEQDEDDNSHHPSNHSVVRSRRTWHGCGVFRRLAGQMERGQEMREEMKVNKRAEA